MLQKKVHLLNIYPIPLHQVTIKNKFISLTTIDYGAIIQKVLVKDKYGKQLNAVASFEDPYDYLSDPNFLGACVGRFAGRISGGSFTLDGSEYPIYQKDGVHLHGGKKGFGRKYWTLLEVHEGPDPFVKYGYKSPHLEEGYPGNLIVTVTYQLIGNALKIIHEATTDQPTIVNLTNHSYFRLDRDPGLDQYRLMVNATHRLETDKKLLPTGNIVPVEDTQYDFRKPSPIDNIHLDTPYTFVPGKWPIVVAVSETSGIRLSVSTNQHAVVVYTPDEFPAICFETQNYPDAPSHTSFPSSVLRPGETYFNESLFTFDLVP